MVVPVILYGSPVLRKYSAEVTEEDDIQKISDNLFNTLEKAEGVGLAAPQIDLLKRVFVINTNPLAVNDNSIEKFTGIFINPEIVDFAAENNFFSEGCLSIPGIFEEVSRPKEILGRYQDLQFNTHEEGMDDIKARIFQHEYDHLEGVLFIDRINRLRRKLLTGKLNKIKRNTTNFSI